MTKLTKTAQAAQTFVTECVAHGFEVTCVEGFLRLVSHFQPHDLNMFNHLNSKAVRLLLNTDQWKYIAECEGLGASVALERGVIEVNARLKDRFAAEVTKLTH